MSCCNGQSMVFKHKKRTFGIITHTGGSKIFSGAKIFFPKKFFGSPKSAKKLETQKCPFWPNLAKKWVMGPKIGVLGSIKCSKLLFFEFGQFGTKNPPRNHFFGQNGDLGAKFWEKRGLGPKFDF